MGMSGRGTSGGSSREQQQQQYLGGGRRYSGGLGGEGGVTSNGLVVIDEHASLRTSSPLKQKTSYDPASPMKNAAARSSQGQPSYAAVTKGRPAMQQKEDQSTVPKNWSCGDLLGQGAFGSVYLGMDNDSGTLMAVKQVSLGHGAASAAKLAEHVKLLEAEVRLLKQLDHPNIVRYIGTEKTSKVLNIFLEYVPGGSIASLLANFGPFQESVVKLYTKQILMGLEYLHKNSIMHRDIKGANILVDNTGLVKLADFGASKKIEELVTVGSGANSVKGTPYWMAPEVITQSGHGREADIWSVACTVIEMATGRPPWSHCGSQVSAMFHIAKSKGPPLIPNELSEDCRDFLYLCFNRNWRERPSATALLNHPFLAGVKCPTAVVQQPHVTTVSQRQSPNRPTLVHSSKVIVEGTATSPDPREKAEPNQPNVADTGRRTGARRQLQLDSIAPRPSKQQMQSSSPSKRTQAMRASAPVFSMAAIDRSMAARPMTSRPEQSPIAEKNEEEQVKVPVTIQEQSRNSKDQGESSNQPSTAGGTSTSGGSYGSFNPVQEPEGPHQKAKDAIDSLKASMMMQSKGNNTSSWSEYTSSKSGDSRVMQAATSISSGSSGAPNVGTSHSKGTISSSCPSGSSNRSNGPIVYTVAADISNGSSIPGLPWDVNQSWTSGSSKHTVSSSGQQSSATTSSGRGAKSSDCTDCARLQTIPSGILGSLSSLKRTDTSNGGTAPATTSTESLERHVSHEISCSSGSSQASQENCKDDAEIRKSSSFTGYPSLLKRDHSLPRMGVKEFHTPRKTYSRSTASTPGQTPSRIPRAPLPDRSPRALDGRSSSGAIASHMTPRRSLPSTPSRNVKASPSVIRHSTSSENAVGSYEQQHLRQLERKRSGSTPARSMGPPPPVMAGARGGPKHGATPSGSRSISQSMYL